MKLRICVVVGTAMLAVAGCKPNLAKISDEQLLQLLGHGGTSGAPVQIGMRVTECADLLSGKVDEVNKDAPAELIGMMKTDCRAYLNNRLTDSALNTTELELADFERPELAERLSSLKGQQDNALRAFTEKQESERRAAEEREKQARRDELTAAAAEASEAIAELKAGVIERAERMKPACAALIDARNRLSQINWEHRLLLDELDIRCVEEPTLAGEVYAVSSYEQALAGISIRIEQDQMIHGGVPSLPAVNLPAIDGQIAEIEKKAGAIRAALPGE